MPFYHGCRRNSAFLFCGCDEGLDISGGWLSCSSFMGFAFIVIISGGGQVCGHSGFAVSSIRLSTGLSLAASGVEKLNTTRAWLAGGRSLIAAA